MWELVVGGLVCVGAAVAAMAALVVATRAMTSVLVAALREVTDPPVTEAVQAHPGPQGDMFVPPWQMWGTEE